MNFTRGQRISLRLAALAGVNASVYFLYLSAIRAAKKTHVTYMDDDGSTNYDASVARAYKQYFGVASSPGESKEAKTNDKI
jgi:hypothetical protein